MQSVQTGKTGSSWQGSKKSCPKNPQKTQQKRVAKIWLWQENHAPPAQVSTE
jgi:hypothetical protein